MKTALQNLILSLSLVALLTGMTCQSRTTYTTLWAAESAVSSAFAGYMDRVVTGKTPTNAVPMISAAYNDFQVTMAAAVQLAQTTNAPITPELAAKAKQVTTAINLEIAQSQ